MRTNPFWMAFVAILLVFNSCKDDDRIGFDLIDDKEVISESENIFDIQSQQISLDTVYTAHNGYGIVGQYNDPIFGQSELAFAFQLQLSSALPYFTEGSKSVAFGTHPKVDSVVMSFSYDTVYTRPSAVGETETPQQLELFQLNDTTPELAYMFTDVPTSKHLRQLASVSHTFGKQSKTHFRFKIQNSDFVNNFLQYTDTFRTTTKLQKLYKGFVLRPTGGTNSLTRFDISNGNTWCKVYYKNDQVAGKDTVMLYTLSIGVDSRYHTFGKHTWNSPALSGKVDNPNATNASRIYVQSLSGTRTKLTFPSIRNWRKNEKVHIRAAELILRRDESTNTTQMPNLSSLVIYKLNSSKSNLILPEYYNTNYYDYNFPASFDKVDGLYRFDITSYITALRETDTPETGLVIAAPLRGVQFGRAVLHSAQSENEALRMYLKITYTKL